MTDSRFPIPAFRGYVGGYALERLIRASAAGRMEPKAQIGDVVRKGQLLALTGGKPVYSQLDGVIRGMLQEGVQVKKGSEDWRCGSEKGQEIVLSDLG